MIPLTVALVIPILILGLIYIIIYNNELPLWIEKTFRNSSSIWTGGIITISLISIIKYLIVVYKN